MSERISVLNTLQASGADAEVIDRQLKITGLVPMNYINVATRGKEPSVAGVNREVTYEVTSANEGVDYSISVDGIIVRHTASINDGINDIAEALEAQLKAHKNLEVEVSRVTATITITGVTVNPIFDDIRVSGNITRTVVTEGTWPRFQGWQLKELGIEDVDENESYTRVMFDAKDNTTPFMSNEDRMQRFTQVLYVQEGVANYNDLLLVDHVTPSYGKLIEILRGDDTEASIAAAHTE